ncbi:MAG TPA: MucB/RseB C-terminal domain-containing protein [Gammaproteobacteria bacterium]|jgi:sigma-E factor negative regulatory protein RseB|nr:MucB/RseB C-terminal domain-containing protein [Gammaproteobacteria bacterium]
MALKSPSLLAPPLLLLTLVAGHATAQEARNWLDRMNRAVDQLNYRGTFVHVVDGTPETLHIVHRNVAGSSGERILSADGPRREIVREGDQVQWILPDRKLVLLETRKDVSPLVSALPSYSTDLEDHYEMNLRATARVANRPAQIVEIKPRDEFRYGYMLWLDQETAMPLKSQLIDERGRTVEQILFTELRMADDVAASELEPTINTQGFATLRPPESAPLAAAEVPWRAADVPGGFKLSVATQSPMPGSQYPVEHLVYSDGLATVSVFIEDPKTKADVNDGFSKVGSTNTFSLTLSGRKVTAVGEVPRQTVRTIASSLVAK